MRIVIIAVPLGQVLTTFLIVQMKLSIGEIKGYLNRLYTFPVKQAG